MKPTEFSRNAEQAVPAWDLDGMPALNRSVNVPISADKSVSTDTSPIEMIKKHTASVNQKKVRKNGGLHYTRNLWVIPDAAGMGTFPGDHP